ncbi:TIGR04282 family arsenosugar biosynthesis glycosyltransferase [Asanoa iriomotensis]|uniref:DUF2064 domain-containing protein n=1 Tax=Asanoa iriomotensis TaxID=234613 RepID=A0ABQ4C1X0_9ACTN|nr:DUF2064 domain-containing protein [Asanoa iriomotensis]GIF56782.1 hypothetical protein Air01nite_28770 [Asanoa iriomotensis]
MTAVLVVAKAPVPGLAKTRLCPPATPRQAAEVAHAALVGTANTVRAVAATPVLAHTGRFADAVGARALRRAFTGWRRLPQRGAGLAERLANAHADLAAALPGHAVVQIGMDTPQVTAALLDEALRRLDDADAVLGPAADGGWWAIGFRDPRHAAALRAVPMSTAATADHTRAALVSRGLRIAELPVLTDVDDWPAARAVAALIPASRFARVVNEVAA